MSRSGMFFCSDLIEKLEYLANIPSGGKISLKYLAYYIGVTGATTRSWYQIDRNQNLAELETLLADLNTFLRTSEGLLTTAGNKERMINLLERAALGLDELHKCYLDQVEVTSKLRTIQNRLRLYKLRISEWGEVEEELLSDESSPPSSSSSSIDNDDLVAEVRSAAERDTIIATTPIIRLGGGEFTMGTVDDRTDFDTITYETLLKKKYGETYHRDSPLPSRITRVRPRREQ